MRAKKSPGFTVPELLVVMTITGLLTAVLAIFYSQSRLTLQRGMARTELQQRARLASIRIIPKITSTIYQPATDTTPTINPIASPPSTNDENSTPANPGREIVLNTTAEFVQTQLREATIVPFNPRAPVYDQLRLRFEVDETDPELGDRGTLIMDRNTAGTNDDVPIASNLTSVIFRVLPGNVVRLRVEARGYIPNATSGRSVTSEVYETDIFLPVDTNSGGS